MRLPAVRGACGLSRASIYQWIRDGRFPAPIKLGAHISVWDSLAISAWIEARCIKEDGPNVE
ncbi:MAG: helix-turn-helix transcriptional regulator [Pseudomonas fluorescens]